MHSRPRTIYLAGPMRGHPEFNYPEFRRVAEILRKRGHLFVYDPSEWGRRAGVTNLEAFPIRRAFADYCNFITMHADTIVLLPGWQASVGATAEHALAKVCGLDIFEWKE